MKRSRLSRKGIKARKVRLPDVMSIRKADTMGWTMFEDRNQAVKWAKRTGGQIYTQVDAGMETAEQYIIIKRTNWYSLFKTIGALILGIISLFLGSLLYEPFITFYIPIYRDTIIMFLLMNFITWMWVFIDLAFNYEPNEKEIIIRKGKA